MDEEQELMRRGLQACDKCGYLIGICAGTKEAVCGNCGYKDPCCD